MQLICICISIYLSACIFSGVYSDCRCVPLEECPTFMKLLQKPTRKIISRISKAICRVKDRKYEVCCPLQRLPLKCGKSFRDDHSRIVGGVTAPLGQYPWIALFMFKRKDGTLVPGCGGSLISDRYVLSAAHCFDTDSEVYAVRLGEWDLNSSTDCEETQNDKFCAPKHIEFRVTKEQITTHREFGKRAPISDDIALIRLNTPLDLEKHQRFIHPICVPPPSLDVFYLLNKVTKYSPVVAGWGITDTEKGQGSRFLKHLFIEVVNDTVCKKVFPLHYVDKQLCAGGNKDEDSCNGDSGGPLAVKGPDGPPYLLLGIVSYGKVNCGTEDAPGVYTNVAKHSDWIQSNIFE